MRAWVLAVFVFLAFPALADQPVWLQAIGPGTFDLRVIVPQNASCPSAQADQAPISLIKSTWVQSDFPIALCRAPIPAGAKSVAVNDQHLPLPVHPIRKVVVFGDSGCRLKAPSAWQACNDPTAWPFARIAQLAAAAKPDLVIHVGDYHYRESPCPPGNAGCEGSPSGYGWDAWNADFFAPARPLLTSAPWVMVRGNHEDCHRAGLGWTLLLAPNPSAPPCQAAHAPYTADLSGIKIVIVDDNDSPDGKPDAGVAARLTRDLIAAVPLKTPWWLLTHHPPRGISQSSTKGDIANPALADALEAVKDKVPAPAMIVSGHIHTFQVENFTDGLAPQWIMGTGGDLLEKESFPSLAGVKAGDKTVADGFGLPDFGYAILEADDKGWRITGYDMGGNARKHCRLGTGRIDCED